MMWRLFKKNNEIRISPKYYLLIQDKWVKKMNLLTSDLSRRSLVIYLSLFIIITGGFSIYNVYNGFYTEENIVKTVIISNGNSIVVKSASYPKTETILPTADFENISRINFYLDSLKQSKDGLNIYDSIDNYRPGLLDSLKFITNYYKTNFKK
jgi:hypothetical protein